MKEKLLIYFGILCIPILFLFSCEHELPDANEMPKVCFETEVLPIFQTGCGITGCHDVTTAEDDFIYVDYNSIMESITPGNADDSQAYKSIISLIDDPMPPDAPLSEGARTLIRIWIEQGAENNDCSEEPPPTGVDTTACFTRDVLPILLSSCGMSNCHDEVSHEDDIILTSYNYVIVR